MPFFSKNVCVVVLGDIGHSPRMQYHSLSLAQMGHKVDIVGYGESEPLNEVKATPSIYYHYLLPCPTMPFKYMNYIFKTLWQAATLILMFFMIRRPDIVLVQNPPAIPVLVICYLFCFLFGSELIIDWHNYAHTIMALTNSPEGVLVSTTKRIETYIGGLADHNFCVTNAMKMDLKSKFDINAITLYDRPPHIFRPISLEEMHDLFMELGKKYMQLVSADTDSNLFTEKVDNQVRLKSNRPGLLVSSTSWTEDEDFSILFSALQEFESHHKSGNSKNLPNLLCVITGKGPLKNFYCTKIAQEKWEHVTIMTPWLDSKHYPQLLAAANLGVSLHTSSSGLDLPMKVVDMFGCGLPVCAYNFKCLKELVKPGKNGYVFQNKDELSEQLFNWFERFPNNKTQIATEQAFKEELKDFQEFRWKENWMKVASPLFK